MNFKHIPTGKTLTPGEVRRKYLRYNKDGRQHVTILPKEVHRWDPAILKQLELEKV